MTDKYILNEQGEPVPEPDLHKWAEWYEHAMAIVKQEQVGDVFVSTVFLGLDHDFTGTTPILWESIAFTKTPWKIWGGCQMRCAGGREQAEAMHERMVEVVRAKRV